MARKYSRELQETALHKATVMGIALKQVADEAGVSLTTLRRWIKAHGIDVDKTKSSVATVRPQAIQILLLEQEDIAPKIERILHNEGFQPRLNRLAQHPLGCDIAETSPWLTQTWVFELPEAGARRLIKLIERSGKDIPLVLIGTGTESGVMQACATLDYEAVEDRRLNEISCRLERLYIRKMQRIQLRDCRRHFEQLQRCCYQVFDAAPNPIAILRDTGHIYANPAYMHLYGYADFTSLKEAGLTALLGAPDGESVADILARADDSFSSVSIEISVSGHSTAAGIRKMRAEFTHFPGISRGVQVILQPLDKQIGISPASELQNGCVARSTWLQSLQTLVTTHDHAPAGMLYIRILDLDQVQKAIGYAQCDTLLDEVCILLKSLFPEQSLLSRFESNVITGLVMGGDRDAWVALANSLYTDITEHAFRFFGQTVRLRLAIGLCAVEGQCKDSERFVTWAAEAAGHAEHKGGVGVYDIAASGCSSEEHALWAERIARALKDDNLFSIVYQPIVNLNGDTEACYEALLRLHNEGGGEYLPGKFLPAAQEAGLMGVIDHWVIRHTAQVIKTEAARRKPITMFVNISRETLVSEDFCAWLGKLLDDNQIDPKAFVFEVPESEVLLYGIRCQPVLAGIRALGCAIALDHFVGREESFSLLHSIDVDFVKLDASLARALGEGRAGQERVSHLAAAIGVRGKKSIASCVQDAESVALLWKCGVDYVQGYFLQQPSKALEYDFINGDYEVSVSDKF